MIKPITCLTLIYLHMERRYQFINFVSKEQTACMSTFTVYNLSSEFDKKWPSVPPIGSQVKSTFYIANTTPLFTCSLSIREYAACIRVKILKAQLKGNFWLLSDAAFTIFKCMIATVKAALAFDQTHVTSLKILCPLQIESITGPSICRAWG